MTKFAIMLQLIASDILTHGRNHSLHGSNQLKDEIKDKGILVKIF